MPKKLSKELKDEVVADYLAGVTTREIIKKHKTYELYSILEERNIEYKQNNDRQRKRYTQIIDLYLKGEKIKTIEEITGCKFVYRVLEKFNISRERNPKEYNTNKKEERNQKLIKDYTSGNYSIDEISSAYNMSCNNIYRILKVYGITPIRNKNHHWVINQKVRQTPSIKCKFYILENYYGYTKIGITTKKKIKDRYRKNINVFYEMENTLEYCYNLETSLKKILKGNISKNIDKKIDGWSECYDLKPDVVFEYVKSSVSKSK